MNISTLSLPSAGEGSRGPAYETEPFEIWLRDLGEKWGLTAITVPIIRYQLALALFTALLVITALGLTISYLVKPEWIGYSISCSIIILVSTSLVVVEWFNTFEISKNMITQLIVTSIVFIAYILTMWLSGPGSFALAFLFFGYPLSVLVVFAMLKWWDDNWVMSNFVRYCLGIGSLMIIIFLAVITGVYNPWQIGASLLVAFVCFIIAFLLYPILSQKYPKFVNIVPVIIVLILIIYAAVWAAQPHQGFWGFSMAWGLLFLFLLTRAVMRHRQDNQSVHVNYMFSPSILPVFNYDITPGTKNPLIVDNSRVYTVLALLFVLAFWGTLAVFFQSPIWIGLAAQAVAVNLIIIYILEALTRPLLLMRKAVNVVGEGSPEYISIVNKSKMLALKAQISGIKAISATDDINSDQSPSPAHRRSYSNIFRSRAAGAPSGEALWDLGFNTDVDLALNDEEKTRLGLNDLEAKRGNEMNWTKFYSEYSLLRQTIPWPPFYSCGVSTVYPPKRIPWTHGDDLTRQEALVYLLKLHHEAALRFHLQTKYQTHLQIEILLAVDAYQAELAQEMLTMLRESGMPNATAEEVKLLKPDQKMRLEQALVTWRIEQKIRKAERKKKREEELINHKRRQEEAAKRDEERRQLELKEAEEQIELETGFHDEDEVKQADILSEDERVRRIISQNVTLIQSRPETRNYRRQKEEARKQAEAELKFKADAEAVAERLKAKEKLKKEIEALKEEQRRLEAEQRQQEALSQIKAAINGDICTFKVTGETFYPQQWFECHTCHTAGDGFGLCRVCLDVCHKGHNVVDKGYGPFFCDCGKLKCKATLPPMSRVIEEEKKEDTTAIIMSTQPITKTKTKTIKKVKPAQLTKAEIERQYKETRVPFVDKDFPADMRILVSDPSNTKHKNWLDYKFLRPEQFLGVKKPILNADSANSMDIVQGALGDCWLLSAMTVLTRRPKEFKGVFETLEHSEAGFYSVNLFHNGKRVNVIIDSFFPTNSEGVPAFVRCGDPSQLWAMILEKAYAKLHYSYENIECGFVDQALVDLSGGIGNRVDLTKDTAKQQMRNGLLFSQLLSYQQSGFLMGAGTPAGSDNKENLDHPETANASGIIQGHAYAILDIVEIDGNQLIQLRNPWGKKEWNGDWSDGSDRWNRRMRVKLKYEPKDDGAFWMSFRDFCIHFEDIYICRFFDQPNWFSQPVIESAWSTPVGTDGGCTNFETVKNSPQYLLSTFSPKTTVVINLAQEDVRGLTNRKMKAISLELYQNKGHRITRTRCGVQVASNPESYVFRREVSLEVELGPTPYPLTLLASTFNPKEEATFTLQVYSTQEIEFKELKSL